MLLCDLLRACRLSQKGVLGDIVEEWEDWQHERLLRGLQAQNKAAARQARKHKRDEVEVDLDAPRQVRTGCLFVWRIAHALLQLVLWRGVTSAVNMPAPACSLDVWQYDMQRLPISRYRDRAVTGVCLGVCLLAFAAVQTRTRRVPQALQDYQVEAVTAGTPEPPAIVSGSTPAGTVSCALRTYAELVLALQAAIALC